MVRISYTLMVLVVVTATSLVTYAACRPAEETKTPAGDTTERKDTMKLGYMLIYVDNVDKTLTFFQEAFGLERKFYNIEGDQAYGELDTGATTLGFVSYELMKSHGVEFSETKTDGPAPAFDIGFVTDDVEAAYEKAIAAGAVAVAPPETKPWGQTVSYVRDINGFLVGINSPMGG